MKSLLPLMLTTEALGRIMPSSMSAFYFQPYFRDTRSLTFHNQHCGQDSVHVDETLKNKIPQRGIASGDTHRTGPALLRYERPRLPSKYQNARGLTTHHLVSCLNWFFVFVVGPMCVWDDVDPSSRKLSSIKVYSFPDMEYVFITAASFQIVFLDNPYDISPHNLISVKDYRRGISELLSLSSMVKNMTACVKENARFLGCACRIWMNDEYPVSLYSPLLARLNARQRVLYAQLMVKKEKGINFHARDVVNIELRRRSYDSLDAVVVFVYRKTSMSIEQQRDSHFYSVRNYTNPSISQLRSYMASECRHPCYDACWNDVNTDIYLLKHALKTEGMRNSWADPCDDCMKRLEHDDDKEFRCVLWTPYIPFHQD